MTASGGPAPRGRCPYCGRRFALTKDGKVRRHYIRGDSLDRLAMLRRVCGGSGQQPTAGSTRESHPAAARVRGYSGYRLPPGRRGSTT